MQARQVILSHRPTGIAQAGDFEIVETRLPTLRDGQILIANEYLSVEPAMRGWIADQSNYSAPVEIGSVMRSLACGRILQSRAPAWEVGRVVCGWFGWQDLAVVEADSIVRAVDEPDLPPSLSLGVLGLNGVTAYIGLSKFGLPREGETVVVSSAAGSVGSAVGQIGKILGCRTIGIAGGAAKTRRCLDGFGFDFAIDYQSDDIAARLEEFAPGGVDIYFDNVSGPISDAVMEHLAIGARVVICGTASITDWSRRPSGPRVERHLLVRRARMQGFVVLDHRDEQEAALAQLTEWVRDGRLKYREHILDGLEACPGALSLLYRGENDGKLIVRV